MNKKVTETRPEKTLLELRRRTQRSFVRFISLILIALGIWSWARSREEAEGIQRPFRTVLNWNGSLWHSLFRPTRPNVVRHLPITKPPRFNGDIGLKSEINLSSWSMTVISDDQKPEARKLEISMAEIRAMPRTETATEFKCVEGWSDEISYAGVKFSDFLQYVQMGAAETKTWDPAHPPKDLYPYVGLETPDGEYYVSLDMESMLHPQTLLAYEMNGKPLDLKNGAPLRLIIPVKYGIKSLKRIGAIFFSTKRPPDYWAEQGYDWFAGL